MKPAMFEDMTHMLGAPEGWDAERNGECGGLPVMVEVDDAKRPQRFTSCWVLEPEEIATIVAGGRIYLTVFAPGQPPVSLSVRAK